MTATWIGSSFSRISASRSLLRSVSSRVELSIYNVAGRRIARLLQEPLDAGYHSVAWDRQGAGPASGVYLAVLRVDGRELRQKITVLHD